MNWSQYQQDIFDAVAGTDDSLLIEAVAGSGKTSTIVEAINYVPQGQSVCFVAFNKSIADELQRRVTRPGAQCMTLHSAGWAAWRRSLGWDSNLCKVDQNKTFTLMKEVIPWRDREKWGETTRKLVALGKQAGIVPHDIDMGTKVPGAESHWANSAFQGLVDDEDSVWEALCDHYGIEFEEVNLDLVRKVLAKGIEIARESCDFDDMLYMPVVAGVSFDQWDVVFVDEAQDLSGIQIEMLGRMVRT